MGRRTGKGAGQPHAALHAAISRQTIGIYRGDRDALAAGVTKEIAELHKAGKHTVLMRVRSGNATKFVAVPLGQV